jgi:DNA-binding transcriptional LysR family regulator
MTFQQLRYFLETCRTGSFTAAADALYVAQPSVAQQIRSLEQEVGMRLFVRTGRRLELTEAGNTLRRNAERVIVALEEAETSLQGARNLKGGAASLGTFGIAHRYLVKDVVTSFAARHPEVTIRIVGQHSVEVIEQVRSGELEAGLVSMPEDQPSLDIQAIASDEILYVERPGPATERPMTIERLAERRLISWPTVVGWRDTVRRKLKARAEAAGVKLNAAVEVEHFESALELVELGLGGTYIERTIAESDDFPPGLDTTPFEPALQDTYAFIRRRDHRLSPATAELVRLAREQMESHTWLVSDSLDQSPGGDPDNSG